MKLETVAGKKVLVTGAAMGLGKLFAERAVREGAAAVVLWDINEVALKSTAAELTALGGTIHHVVVDVSAPDQISEAAQAVRDEVGDIDILVNNAGIVRGNTYFWETTNRADIDKTMAINSLAPMYVTLEFLPAMVAGSGQARVLNIASSAGLVSNPRMSVYAASKWAALGWSDSVRIELEQAGHDHVKVTTVCPTYIDTGMFDGAKGFLLTPILKQEEVVDTSWQEMKNGGALVILPWTSRLNKALSGILPLKLRDLFLDTVGVYRSMEEFTGRK
ncbi:SDR family NAD(P)-dependent oxidoreductase [Nocardia cyriacigeorgica]|uniref:SDR family NAD(P)-dependent oxidoreductase n=1 Tax=Nocardia cyriacigeorgica TaxID=135487 RepID=UPI001894AE31|nr:SDR family NAD(P)-dependent oxidoreductase [Nocardia cyriacigeorgica]MBF6096080.1 SDR family NAD(P)-dependent oxidoreductase [Nocardia cyriacigeorgica]MBF6399559.1 SDR family NAD(P)-dependent oxidoreductase [Nocardia cyriacigeorgica]MBF6405189.1 SDR family NAD(P)-dependent oxidoreductase [Nocardia cyriacigeorgica]